MYDFLRQAITSHTYTDLTSMTAKVDKAWAFGSITDAKGTTTAEIANGQDGEPGPGT